MSQQVIFNQIWCFDNSDNSPRGASWTAQSFGFSEFTNPNSTFYEHTSIHHRAFLYKCFCK